jgi:AmmeMemoRadiSam system protein A
MSYSHPLADDEKRELLRIARATLREHSFSGRIPPGKPHRESLLTPAAVFVTLHLGDELRGCIGTVDPEKPLYRAIQEMAVAAATRDPRFPPVSAEEVEDLQIEISVIGATRTVKGPDEIVIGQDGVRLEVNGHRGLLLPQVATEAGWDAKTLVAKACAKAGLGEDAWRDPGATLLAFGAQVFSDATHPAIKKPGA